MVNGAGSTAWTEIFTSIGLIPIFYLGIANNPEALAELEQVARELMKGPSSVMVICCEDHGDTIGEIIAASVNGISKLQEKVQDFKYPVSYNVYNRFCYSANR